MSYILDALRKADAERARGSVPTLNAQPLGSADAAVEMSRSGLWRWVALAAVLGLLGALGWWWGGREPEPVSVSAIMPTTPAPAPAVEVVAPQALPAPATRPPPAAEAPPLRTTITLPAPPPAPAASAAVPVSPIPFAAASRVLQFGELPADLKRQLPTLTMGGSVYSDRPASRFVMINGQLLREGDTVVPGLLLESLGPRSAIFVFRKQRFELPY